MGKFILWAPLIFTAFILLANYRKRRSQNGGTPVSAVSFIYPAIVVYVVSALFFGLVSIAVSPVIRFFSGPKYEAKVIAHEIMDSSDGDNTYTAVVEFKNDRNQLIRKPLNYGSSHPVKIGETITISYKNGDHNVTNLSFGTQKLIVFIVALFLFILGLAMAWITLYSLGWDTSVVLRTGIGFVVYLVFPGGMLFFIGILSWVIWEYFQGKRDDLPIWVLGICSLFVTLLIPSFLGYMKMLFTRERKIKSSARFYDFKKRISK